jgi:rod shape-determining protein MreC
MLSSANSMVGHVFSISNSAMSYLHLREENKMLFDRNGQLELDLLKLQRKIELLESEKLSYDDIMTDSIAYPYHYIQANVVNNSVIGLHNYITIDKGRADGVLPDMGVVSTSGVVGIIAKVGDRFSVVLPLLNIKSKLSCKSQRGFDGSLVWDGRDSRYSNLEQLASHAEFQKGDTIMTSGYSAIFPPGIMVGHVTELNDARDYNSLKIELATDFERIKTVRVVKYDYQRERREVEREARKND